MAVDGSSGKNVQWLYQARRVLTMAAGGGAEIARITITMPAGTVGRLVSLYAQGTASAGSTLTITLQDEDAAEQSILGYAVAGASRRLKLPSIGTAANAHDNYPDTNGMLLGPGQNLVINASAAANAETLTVGIVLLMTAKLEPTWATTGSGGTPTLAASTISAANNLQPVIV